MKTTRKHLLWTLFKNCFLISSCTFGGGVVVMSILKQKFVDELHWISEAEIWDLLAIAQSCPGVMAVNAALIIGYQLAGYAGAVVTTLGTVIPPMVILSAVSRFYMQIRYNPVIMLIFKGMQSGVVAVILYMSFTNIQSILKLGSKLTLVMAVGAISAAVFFDVNLVIILLVCGTIGGISTMSRFTQSKGGASA